jgi:hypothetical protein
MHFTTTSRAVALAALTLAAIAAAEMRHAEDFRVSMIGELSGLSVSTFSATITNGIPPPGIVSRRVNTRDVLGADHRLSYTLESRDDVVVLEHHDGVLGVDCGTPGQLTVRVADIPRFLDNLPADPDTVLFVLGPGWGCKSPSPDEPLEEDATTSIEPDGDNVYLRSTGILADPASGGDANFNKGSLLTFEVQRATIMDVFSDADISYTRTMDPDAREALQRTTKQAEDNAAAAAAAHATNASSSSNSSDTTTSGRRLSLAEAYARTRVLDDHPLAGPSPGLTPHKRALRRLGFTYSTEAGTWQSACYSGLWNYRCNWGVDGQYK